MQRGQAGRLCTLRAPSTCCLFPLSLAARSHTYPACSVFQVGLLRGHLGARLGPVLPRG